MASYRGRNVTLSFSRDEGQTWERLGAAITSFGTAALEINGALAEFGRSTVEAAAEMERGYQRLRQGEWRIDAIPLRWYEYRDELRRQMTIGLQDQSNGTVCEQRIDESLLCHGRAPDVIRMVTEQLGEAMLTRLSEAGVSQARLELYRQFIREHIYQGFVWGTPRRSREEVSLCHCHVCQRRPYREPGRASQEEYTYADVARARDLLLSCLTPTQQEEYATSRSFTVKAKSGNRYRIQNWRSYNVVSLDKKGQPVSELCAGPVEDVPLEDQMLAQKLLLEVDEAGFLAMANWRSVNTYPSFMGLYP